MIIQFLVYGLAITLLAVGAGIVLGLFCGAFVRTYKRIVE